MRFVLELTKNEANAIKRANKKVKKVFSRIKDSFKVKIVNDKEKLNTKKAKK
ncbi:hypothetical protein J4225_00585 [Candidatus Pacearchaeota archaeon]|nr:hypothetical protein [Candidatus Pacearchaeota archaeon]